jgi:hypothetical protein
VNGSFLFWFEELVLLQNRQHAEIGGSRGGRSIHFIRYQSNVTGGAAMPVTVKNISLWRWEVENQVGTLAHTLESVTKAKANLRVLMGYRYPGEGTKDAIELYPVAVLPIC